MCSFKDLFSLLQDGCTLYDQLIGFQALLLLGLPARGAPRSAVESAFRRRALCGCRVFLKDDMNHNRCGLP